MRRRSSPAAPLIKVGAGFGIAGLVMAALGVAGVLHVIRGSLGMAILAFVAAALGLGVAGYLFWGYAWLNKRPEKLQKLKDQDAGRNPS